MRIYKDAWGNEILITTEGRFKFLNFLSEFLILEEKELSRSKIITLGTSTEKEFNFLKEFFRGKGFYLCNHFSYFRPDPEEQEIWYSGKKFKMEDIPFWNHKIELSLTEQTFGEFLESLKELRDKYNYLTAWRSKTYGHLIVIK